MTLSLALVLGLVVVPPAAAQIDVYTTPGRHEVNGRLWSTTCAPYSKTVERCTTQIWATVTSADGRGGYTRTTGWVFNNLTYKPSPRTAWGPNPLANSGSWTAPDGRRWRTDCDTAVTGRNGCRSYTLSSVVVVEDGRAAVEQRWVVNNIVLFSSGTSTTGTGTGATTIAENCDTSVLPAGYAVTNGVPHSVKPPYTPIDQFNPVSVALFVDAVSKMTTITAATKLCLMRMAGDLALSKSVARTDGGRVSLWYPYGFSFSANPATPTLQPGWYSGMAQGAMISAFGLLHDATTGSERQKWADAAHRTFASFAVPYGAGGFTHHLEISGRQVLFFEEYPTGATPTSVLNGHHVALMALSSYDARFGSSEARALFDEAVSTYHLALKVAELPVEGGIMSTYDLVRGYPVAPLRYVSLGGTVTQTRLNGRQVSVPAGHRTTPARNVIEDPGLSGSGGWGIIGTGTTIANGVATLINDGRGWTGIQQVIPAGTFATGTKVSLQFQAKATYPYGRPGVSPRYVVYQTCPSGTRNVLDRQKNRGDVWAIYRDEFTVVDGSCPILLQLLTVNWIANDTVVRYDNVSMRASDPVGAAATPAYDLYVWRTPVNNLTLYGSGLIAVEAYWGGRWQPIIQFNALPEGRTVQIPEEHTGRNIHYGYHDTSHIQELQTLHRISGLEYFATYAERWLPLAPSNPH